MFWTGAEHAPGEATYAAMIVHSEQPVGQPSSPMSIAYDVTAVAMVSKHQLQLNALGASPGSLALPQLLVARPGVYHCANAADLAVY